jgi:TrmH family RNA methyltransferase
LTPITSSKNALLQDVRRAAATGKPTSDGLVVAEGPHLAEEALRGNWAIEQVLVAHGSHSRYERLIARMRTEVVSVSDRAFVATAATEHPQGVITLLRPREWAWGDLQAGRSLIVALDAVQDPGNAGTIVRSAEAFGATGVVLLSGSVRTANGKFLRAAAGSAFRIPFLENVSVDDFLRDAGGWKICLYALAADGTNDVSQTDWTEPAALILGSEGAGVSDRIRRETTLVRIPAAGVESLNVGIAGSIALFEAARQRRSAG